MSADSKSKNAGRNLKALFSVVCVSVIALGVIVYFTTKPAKDVNEPTTVVETTAVQRSVTVEDTTAEETTLEETTAEQSTRAEESTMPLSESNTPYKSFYQYPLDEVVINS